MNYSDTPAHQLAARVQEKPDLLDQMPGEYAMLCSKSQNLQIFISFEPQAIFQEVSAIKQRVQSGKSLPLAGATVALGDNFCTAGLVTTCASRMLSSYEPPLTARTVEALREQGSVIIGKANMEEFGLGSTGNSSHYGAVKNPWDPDRTAGCGAAAATATLASLALATDSCGEARQAASFCGILALKPSYGRISRRGVVEYAPSLTQPGLMARNTRDLALALEATAGEDPGDPTSLKLPVPGYFSRVHQGRKGKGPLKVALLEDWDALPTLETEVREAFQAQLDGLFKAGLEVEAVSLPSFRESSLAAAVISAVEAFSNLANYDGVRFGYRAEGPSLQEMYTATRTSGFSSKLKQFITFGALVSSEKYYTSYFVKSQKMRTRIARELESCLEEYDLVLTPTVPFTAPRLEGPRVAWQLPDPAHFFTAAANLSGLPALTFPLPSASALPVGLQFIGRFGDEAALLEAAQLLENMNPLQFPHPGFKDQGGCGR